MAGGTYYAKGQHNVICDRSGYQLKSGEAMRTWDGLMVIPEEYEPRHPLDFAATPRDSQTVTNPRPEPEDYFLSDGEVVASDL